MSHFCILLKGIESSDKTRLNYLRVVYHLSGPVFLNLLCMLVTWLQGLTLGDAASACHLPLVLIWYGPPGRVPTPLNTSSYSFNIQSLVIDSLCTLPFSSMESVFHFILGITGSSVFQNSFDCVAALDSLLCTCIVFGIVSAGCELVLESFGMVSHLCIFCSK